MDVLIFHECLNKKKIKHNVSYLMTDPFHMTRDATNAPATTHKRTTETSVQNYPKKKTKETNDMVDRLKVGVLSCGPLKVQRRKHACCSQLFVVSNMSSSFSMS